MCQASHDPYYDPSLIISPIAGLLQQCIMAVMTRGGATNTLPAKRQLQSRCFGNNS